MNALRSSRRHAGFGALHHHLRARIETCRCLRKEAVSPEEKEGWLAEEAGWTEALLGLDQPGLSCHQVPPGQCDRYVVGLRDGRSILLAATALQLVNDMPRERTEKSGPTWSDEFFSSPGKEFHRYA